MPWVKLDDAIGESRKTERLFRRNSRGLGLTAFGLHTLALAYCARNLTDGHVDREWVVLRLKDAGIASARRDSVTDALVDAGQWAVARDGWRIHDFLEYNPSRQDVLERRAADRARKAKGGSNGIPHGIQRDSESPVPPRPAPAFTSNPNSSGKEVEIGVHDATQPTMRDSASVGQPDLSVIEGLG